MSYRRTSAKNVPVKFRHLRSGVVGGRHAQQVGYVEEETSECSTEVYSPAPASPSPAPASPAPASPAPACGEARWLTAGWRRRCDAEFREVEERKAVLRRVGPLFFNVGMAPHGRAIHHSCRCCGRRYYAADFALWCGACIGAGREYFCACGKMYPCWKKTWASCV